jgi:hypothetical protein
MSYLRLSIVMYAVDMLLIALTIHRLQRLLHICESELKWLVGHADKHQKIYVLTQWPLFDITCAKISSNYGQNFE